MKSINLPPAFYTLREAAHAICAEENWHDDAREALAKQFIQAVRDGVLTVQHPPHTDLPYRPDPVRDFYELVTPADVNTWLEKQDEPYRWNAPPLDLISFDEALDILRGRFGATNVELAMWILQDLQAWTFNSSEKCFLTFHYPDDGIRVESSLDAITLLHEKAVRFSKSEVDSFDPDKPDKNEATYTPGRWISYLDAKARIDAAAKAHPLLNIDGVHKAWQKLHAHFKDDKIDIKPMVIGYFPGGCGNIEDGFFRTAEIAKFIKRYIEDASPAPAQTAASSEPVGAASDGPAPLPAVPNWKMLIQTEATAHCLRLRNAGANPTRNSILDSMAQWCRDNDIKTATKINPSANYLRTHVLGGKHWEVPA